MFEPIYGCTGCSTTGGRGTCPWHGGMNFTTYVHIHDYKYGGIETDYPYGELVGRRYQVSVCSTCGDIKRSPYTPPVVS